MAEVEGTPKEMVVRAGEELCLQQEQGQNVCGFPMELYNEQSHNEHKRRLT